MAAHKGRADVMTSMSLVANSEGRRQRAVGKCQQAAGRWPQTIGFLPSAFCLPLSALRHSDREIGDVVRFVAFIDVIVRVHCHSDDEAAGRDIPPGHRG